MSYDRNHSYAYKRNHVFIPTCFYYKWKIHTSNVCYMRNYGITYDEYIWVRKWSNLRGPKENWVPRKYY